MTIHGPGANKENTEQTLLQLIVCLLIWLVTGTSAFAAPILSETVLTTNSDGATSGSFNGGGPTLTSTADLATTGLNRNFVAQYFVPSSSGIYEIGLSSSTEDTVIVFYSGTFQSSSPATNAQTVKDDFTGTRSVGVTMGTCDNRASYCPQITENLVGGQTYYIVVTSYSPNRTVSDGVSLYIYGEPVSFGDTDQTGAAAKLETTVNLEVLNRTKSLIKFNKMYISDAIERHIAYQKNEKQDQPENKLEFYGYKKPISHIFVNENLSKFATSSSITQPVKNGSRWNIDTALSYVNNRNGNETTNSEIRVSVEQPAKELGTIGGAFGLQYNNSDTVNPNSGKVENKGASFTVYNIMNVRENLFLENHFMVASGQGKAELGSNGQIWSSKFDTDSTLYGVSLRGLIEASLLDPPDFMGEKFEIWPSLSFDHGVSKAKNIRSSFEFGSIYENMKVDDSKVKVTEISLAPEFKFRPKFWNVSDLGSTLSVAPGYLCQRISSSLNNNSCGTDIHVSLVRDADGQKLFDFQLQNLTDSETFSASLNLVVPLSDSVTTSRSNFSAPITKRVFLPAVKGGIDNPSSQVRQEPQKVKSQVTGSFSENAVKQIEFESSGKDLVNKEPGISPTEVVWFWDLSKDSWLRVDLDKQEIEN
ncbi:hypothetical protein N9T26_02160 [Alphaproteobacteria bacterium]|nr:hypothetical protein [Alphaproteobacteria bacterium]